MISLCPPLPRRISSALLCLCVPTTAVCLLLPPACCFVCNWEFQEISSPRLQPALPVFCGPIFPSLGIKPFYSLGLVARADPDDQAAHPKGTAFFQGMMTPKLAGPGHRGKRQIVLRDSLELLWWGLFLNSASLLL